MFDILIHYITIYYHMVFDVFDTTQHTKGKGFSGCIKLSSINNAADHRMVANGWAMFEEAIEGVGEGDLPQLLRHLRGVTTPTPPPQPQQESAPPTDSQPTPSPAKKIKTENVGDQPVIVMGGLVHGLAPNVIQLGGPKMAVTPTYGRSTQEKPLCMPSAVFPHTIWIHCRGMKRNTIDLILL